jgi:CheY-like chemotaxis protein
MEVHFASDGHAALASLGQEVGSTLVLTDLYMPVMDGFALVERMKPPPAAPRPCGGDRRRGPQQRARPRTQGVEVYLRKPVKFAEVLETVKRLLRIS